MLRWVVAVWVALCGGATLAEAATLAQQCAGWNVFKAGRAIYSETRCERQPCPKHSSLIGRRLNARCPNDDLPAIQAAVDACVAQFRAAITGDAACTRTKLGAVGKKTYAKAKCTRGAMLAGGTANPRCLALAESQFSQAIASADNRGTCSGTAAALEALVDACLPTLLTGISTTTTTSTTSSTSTSTTSSTSTSTTSSTSTTLPCIDNYICGPGSCGVIPGVTNCDGTPKDCGGCTPPATCGGLGVPNQCGSVPCIDTYICGPGSCGVIPGVTNCDGTPRDCGGCTPPATCGGLGVPNQCGSVPCIDTYICGPGSCGVIPGVTNCDGTPRDCGVCPGTGTCTNNTCVCTPTTCTSGVSCGQMSDGCGGTVECGACPVATDLCLGNTCQDGCVIGGVPYAAGAVNPSDPCTGCAPGVSRTAWSPRNGFACPTGLCVDDVCESDVCFIDGAIRAADATNPDEPCQSCQPAVDATHWSPVATGRSCTDGICVDGTCDSNVCFIDGRVLQNGATNPVPFVDPCLQSCQVSQNRTGWSPLPIGAKCGAPFGCLSGTCLQLPDGQRYCSIEAAVAVCASSDCATGSCDSQTGACTYTPKNVGGSCFVPVITGPSGRSDCLSSNGTCDAGGNCVRPPTTGQPCDHPSTPPCPSDAGATCNASGACVGNIIPDAVCNSFCSVTHPQNVTYDTCKTTAPAGCGQRHFDSPCPAVPSGCDAGSCDARTGVCEYGPYPNGTRWCEILNFFGHSTQECCPGQICRYPTGSGCAIEGSCPPKYCYDPNAP